MAEWKCVNCGDDAGTVLRYGVEQCDTCGCPVEMQPRLPAQPPCWEGECIQPTEREVLLEKSLRWAMGCVSPIALVRAPACLPREWIVACNLIGWDPATGNALKSEADNG